MSRAPLLFLFAFTAAACSDPGPAPSDGGADAADDSPHGCTTGFVGDPAKAPEIVITVLGGTTGAPPVVVMNGDTVPLIFPPQGGRVIFAGAHVRNVEACNATVGGVIRDKASKKVMLDTRTVNLVPRDDGWLETDPTDYASFSNIPVCPNSWSASDIYGNVYELEVTVTDKTGRVAVQTLDITPVCGEPANAAQCACICKGGYVLGQSCDLDAGTDGGDGGDGG